jgi:hypothetical protein
MTITIGTTLHDNGVKLLVTYYDGHTETITGGYDDNLDKQYLGTKPVTIGYKGVTTQIMVTTVCAKMTCERCGFLYELYPDGSNPGCPRCISKTPVFTGNVLKYEEINYTNDILEELYEKGFDGIFSIVDRPMSLEDAIKNSNRLVENAAERIMRIIRIRL